MQIRNEQRVLVSAITPLLLAASDSNETPTPTMQRPAATPVEDSVVIRPQAAAPVGQPLRPLVGEPVPDPYVVRLSATHSISGRAALWMAGTTNEADDTFRLFCSFDGGRTWQRATDRAGAPLSVFAAGQRPAWISTAEPDRWAPEIYEVNGKLLLLYTARHKKGDLRVAAALADHVEGPWRDLGPILESPHGVIDATAVRDPKSGRWLLLYKPDNNSVGLPTPIIAQGFDLRGDRLVLAGRKNELMQSGPKDGGLIEGPAVVHENGTSYVLVSSDCFADARYKTWIAQAPDLEGGAALPRELLLSSTSPCLGGHWVGPGHVSLVKEAPGIYSLYLHAWTKVTEGKAKWETRFRAGEEQRMALRVTLAFRDPAGKPTAPYIVEDRLALGRSEYAPLLDLVPAARATN
jgi:hypothetical protein